MKKLRVHENKNYLMWEDGTPFYYLADTAWELAHKLKRDEIERYMSIRKDQGFNVIQVVALAESDGIGTPNAYGHFPFLMVNGEYKVCADTRSESNYWTDLDQIIQMAQNKDMFIALLPAWGDKFNKKHGIGPEIFNTENAYNYGKWIGDRYRNEWNLIWVLGGDRPLETEYHRNIINSMAEGIKDGDKKGHLITFHPSGGKSSLEFVPNKEYIDFHSIQSGHGMESYTSYRLLRTTKKQEEKPVFDMESRYEKFPACFQKNYGYEWDASDIRQNNYWNMMEGVLGHTYGHGAVWCFNNKRSGENPYLWHEVLEDEGAKEMKYLAQLRLSRSYFDFRNGDELLAYQLPGMGHQCAGRGENYAFIYSPLGMPIYTDLSTFCSYCIKASWFNPRTGNEWIFGMITSKEKVFVPPSSGKGNDWILILDNV